MHGREVKIGLGVIGVLLVLFGCVAYRKFAHRRPEPLRKVHEINLQSGSRFTADFPPA